eukprot:scaffold329711_cov36-Prasinocladus_malaysianus.AAC.3
MSTRTSTSIPIRETRTQTRTMDGYSYQYDNSYRAPRTGTPYEYCMAAASPPRPARVLVPSRESQAKAAIRTGNHTNTTQMNWSSRERDREHRSDSTGGKSTASPWLET